MEHSPPQVRRSFARNPVLIFLGVCFAIGCLWRFTPLHDRIGFETLVQWGNRIEGRPWTLYGVIAVYVLGGLFFFLHAALLWATVFTFDTFHAFVYAELGSLASAMVVYSLGRILRQDVIVRMAGSYLDEVSRALARKGTLSLFLLHIFPVCPFSVLNLLAGATHIQLKDFVAGTVLGMTPGILVVCIFGNQLVQIMHRPNFLDAALLAAFVLAGVWAVSRGWNPNRSALEAYRPARAVRGGQQ